MENSRELAVEILQLVLDKGSYSNIVLNRKLKDSNLEIKDKALVTEIVHGTLKYKCTIDIILSNFLKDIKNTDSFIVNILRISIYQIKYLDKIPDFAVVNEAVEITKHKLPQYSKLVNGVLRNYLRNKDKNFCMDKDIVNKLCYKYSFNEDMVKLFLKQYGEEICVKILEGLNETPSITVRINNLLTSFQDVWDELVELGYEIEEGYVSPEAIRIIRGKSIEQNTLFKQGKIIVQDESAMLVAPSMDLKEGQTVLDLCSAPGGKTTHIAEIINDNGEIKAFDIHENKLSLVLENAKRLHISSIKCSCGDASEYNNELKQTGDRTLIDVPCSGLGIIRKKPEIKWNKPLKDLIKLRDLQKNIMTNAAKYVKIGGELIYSTCTLNKEENEENVRWFLKKFPMFTSEKLYFGSLDNFIYSKEGFVTILPNKYMDGFFIAKFKRQW